MSKLSDRNGRAYEYAYLLKLEEKVKPYRKIAIENNSSLVVLQNAWNEIGEEMRKMFLISADAGVTAILEVEPLIAENADDVLEIKIQPDDAGKKGDVRDIVLTRKNISWEIGFSVKNNHAAAKHSRLSRKLDFGEKWFGLPCSQDYWNDIKPIFDYLSEEKVKKTKWRDLPNKDTEVYVPLLKAFLKELKKGYEIHGEVLPTRMVEYILGKFDFYKAIGKNRIRITQIQPYNLRGTLNKASKERKPKIILPVTELPTRIVGAEFKPDSTTTVELYMDKGWQFALRIHSAETNVIPSLKFDVQIIGMPATIICIDCKWE